MGIVEEETRPRRTEIFRTSPLLNGDDLVSATTVSRVGSAQLTSHHIKQASFSVECSSLPPTRIFLGLVAVAVVPLVFELAPAGVLVMKTSTIHSYHTLRSSVLRHIVTRSSDASGTVSGTYAVGGGVSETGRLAAQKRRKEREDGAGKKCREPMCVCV